MIYTEMLQIKNQIRKIQYRIKETALPASASSIQSKVVVFN